MRAEIIGVGTELLLGQIANTNAQYLSDKLALEGAGVYFHQAVGDNLERIQQALTIAASRSEIIVLTGGLGPTEDDLTREAVSRFLGRNLELDAGMLMKLEQLFAGMGRKMPTNNRKQAMLVEGGRFLDNPRGTAPGQYIEADGCHYFLLPGPPTELKPMVTDHVLPILRDLMGQQGTIRSRVLRLFGIGESAMEMEISDIISNQLNPTVAPLASEGEVTLRITAKAASEEEAFALIIPVEQQLRQRLGKYIYGIDDETLPVTVGKRLKDRGETLALAESCTGGLLASMITDVPGCSVYYKQGWVTYHNEAKSEQLGVSSDILAQHGAVSEECARAMAEGARTRAGTDWAISVTGIAGPDGGTNEKPVGLVYIAVTGPGGTTVKQFNFRGDRQQIRIRSAKNALYSLVRRMAER
ncbi:competence/damage-inducible protein A [Effusibacillus lacus]|uniref:Putative competence-damage inducible protein n=1 Tax=Effusibacillus lacus TaxID=1348429 RepID=A0A292YSQ5_9BACL|nr:competence/damage-inducible protein A [Effusibacillus lacus]TCS76255.1 competence/damage-inducible protein cinA [Effusibacillus lacus]GAX91803.1 competence/damage-inducible protein A [Effusibacillus lacus]